MGALSPPFKDEDAEGRTDTCTRSPDGGGGAHVRVSDAEGPAVGHCVFLLSVILSVEITVRASAAPPSVRRGCINLPKQTEQQLVSEMALGHCTAFSGRMSGITLGRFPKMGPPLAAVPREWQPVARGFQAKATGTCGWGSPRERSSHRLEYGNETLLFLPLFLLACLLLPE